MHIAEIVKTRSNCMKRAVGVVIAKDNRILSTGYNGTPIGKVNCFEGGCERCNKNTSQGKDLEKCFCFHAEENAVLEVGTKNCMGAVLYSTLFPCYQCSKIVLSAVSCE
jgi:dCMP deaminase